MKKVLIFAAVVAAITAVNVGIAFRPSDEKPLDLTTLSNVEFLKALGADEVGTFNGCPFAPRSVQQNLEVTVYFDERAPEDAGRITGVCTPKVPTGPAQ